MRRISASYIFDGKGHFFKNGILELDDNNSVICLTDTSGEIKETPFLEYYNGIITPGFINAHCHLELSYMRGKLNKTENLTGFVSQMMQKRNEGKNNAQHEIEKADREMQSNGIVACGDISNTSDSFSVKSKSKIKYHTFIELLGFDKNKIFEIINNSKKLQDILQPSSIVPHASYSVIPELLSEIIKIARESDSVLSVHNQESIEENDIFKEKGGELAEVLKKVGWSNNLFKHRADSSFKALTKDFPSQNNILFIHNVFTGESDIQLARKIFSNYFWVFCPKSNLYISNRLPDVFLFRDEKERICLGTDSLASNNGLSILEEMKTLQLHFPGILLCDLFTWATCNGAKAIQMTKELGTFESGKKPGVNLVYDLDLQNMRLAPETKIKVLA